MKREMGLTGLMFAAVSAILGSGWLFAPLLASERAGPAAIIAWGIGGAAMLPIALTFAEISAMLPFGRDVAAITAFALVLAAEADAAAVPCSRDTDLT